MFKPLFFPQKQVAFRIFIAQIALITNWNKNKFWNSDFTQQISDSMVEKMAQTGNFLQTILCCYLPLYQTESIF